MNEVIASTLAARRLSMILLDAFAIVALLLASVGLYGVTHIWLDNALTSSASASRWARNAGTF